MKVNILVVDDRPEGILAVQSVLTSPDYNLVTAFSGADALKALLKDDFAVILLDVQMPRMNGFETAAVIKTREKSKDIPIVFMSAINQDEQYVYQGYGVGAVDYLLKPFDPYILRSKVTIFVDMFRKNLLIKEQAKKIYEAEIKSYSQALDRMELEGLRRYQYLADAIPQIVFRLHPDSSYDYFNKVWFEYTGLKAETSASMLWKDAIYVEDLLILMSQFEKASSQGGGIDCECRIRNRKGHYRWHLIRMESERFNGPEEVNTWIGTATDIEDRKKAADSQKFLAEASALLVSTLNYETILNNIAKIAVPVLADWCSFDIVNELGKLETVAIVHKDPAKLSMAKEIHDANLAQNTAELGANHVIKTGISEMYPVLTAELTKKFSSDERMHKLMKDLGEKSLMYVPLIVNAKTVGVLTFVSSDNSREYDSHHLAMADELGKRAALAYENARLYKLSQQAIELRNDFLSIASHELNTPITSLKLQLQMVKKTLANAITGAELPLDRFTKSIDASVKQTDRLINLVQILLDVSRIQSGRFIFTFQQMAVKEVVNEVVDRYREILSSADCNLEVENELNLDVRWDKTRVEQVLINLITNAMKYAPGKIQLKVTKQDEFVKIAVVDFGDGIPANKLSKIFDRFERATSNETVSGLGLGLFIVKQIVEGHHGHIDVNSAAGKGTCFDVFLPINAEIDTQESNKSQVNHQSLQ